jgi:hypothetical protein
MSKATKDVVRTSSIFEGVLKDRILVQGEEQDDLVIQTEGKLRSLTSIQTTQ